MAYLKDLEPNLRDEVKHRDQQDVGGIVITKYPSDGGTLIDVRLWDDHIVYRTPASGWEVVKLNDEAD